MSEARASAGDGRPEPGGVRPSTPIGPERHESARPPFGTGARRAGCSAASSMGQVPRAAPVPLGPPAGAPLASPAALAAPAAAAVAPLLSRRSAPDADD